MNKKTFVYSGRENLEAMTEAENYNKFLINIILQQVGDGKKKKVLDFGAGSGTYAKMLKKHGTTPDCLEPDAILQSTLAKSGFNVVAGSKDLKPNTYDLIYSLNVFEHIENDFEEIKKLQKALKKGGRLIVYVPAYQLLFSSMDKIVGHHRRYRTKRLKDMAASAGLTIKDVGYYDPIGFGAALAYRMIRGKGVLSPKSVKFYDKYAFPVSKLFHPISRKIIGKNAVLIAEK